MKKKSKKTCKVKTSQPSASIMNVSHCTFIGSALVAGSKATDRFASKACYKRDEHKMYHAMNVYCPCCEGGIPVVVNNYKHNQEVRIYGHDVVLINGEKALCLSETFTLIDELQKRVGDLEKKMQSGS